MEQLLIDANALTDEFEWCKQQAAECNRKEWDEIITRVSKQPTVDAVRVVRCNDCDHMKWKKSIYADGTINHCRRCELDNKAHPNDWFCADGKPKGVNED